MGWAGSGCAEVGPAHGFLFKKFRPMGWAGSGCAE
ncbi:unnamed protein product, partial [Rotaria sp. Silwood1]